MTKREVVRWVIKRIWPIFSWKYCDCCKKEFRREHGWKCHDAFFGMCKDKYYCGNCVLTEKDVLKKCTPPTIVGEWPKIGWPLSCRASLSDYDFSTIEALSKQLRNRLDNEAVAELSNMNRDVNDKEKN